MDSNCTIKTFQNLNTLTTNLANHTDLFLRTMDLFLIKYHLFRIMDEFCRIRGLERKLVCFMYNGREIFETDTPKSIGLKHGENIDCFDR